MRMVIDNACCNFKFLDEKILKLLELIFHKFIVINFINFISTKYSRNDKLFFKLSQLLNSIKLSLLLYYAIV